MPATPQRRPRHELAWIWTNFLSKQRRVTDLVETAAGRAANDSLHDARAKTQNKFAMVSMAKKFLHRCMGTHARVHVHFLRGGWHVFRQVFLAPCMRRC